MNLQTQQNRSLWMRWRVRLGYPVGILFWFFAAPTLRSIFYGALIAIAGLAIRAYAAGYLVKYQRLATSGPYARTRNPLYLGSALMAVGFAVAGRSWISGAIILGYFAAVYYAVMRNEESDLRARYGAAFEEYVARVPLFWPRISGARRALAGEAPSHFSWAQYRRNREWRALLGTLIGIGIIALRIYASGWWHAAIAGMHW
ncbi:MAG: isoprenylcysteine carboxylmethyltransferase family protein [Candidatus Acidiferrales bacterium]